MKEPLRHMPLAVLDPTTVEPEDIIASSVLNFTPTKLPSNGISLKHRPYHKWYYYPEMRNDEVLAFTQHVHIKGVDEVVPGYYCSKVKHNFHSAVEDPLSQLKEHNELRKSCEYRVGVFFT